MKRRIEITIETDSVLIASARKTSASWCEGCACEVRMISVDEAAALAQQSARTIYRWVEAQRIHCTETPEGRLFICLNSFTEH